MSQHRQKKIRSICKTYNKIPVVLKFTLVADLTFSKGERIKSKKRKRKDAISSKSTDFGLYKEKGSEQITFSSEIILSLISPYTELVKDFPPRYHHSSYIHKQNGNYDEVKRGKNVFD